MEFAMEEEGRMEDDINDDMVGGAESEEELYNQMVQGQNRVFAERISEAEYARQRDLFTKQSVANLVQSQDYLQWHQVCTSCHANWYHGNSSPDCKECDGYSMTRPCPVCRGDERCSATWRRDVAMSHSFHMGHWCGKCNLPEAEQHALMLRHLVEADPDSLADALEDLGNR
ncbi:uncharacterized protein [Diadema setosum]|uniref:uncharacterized protein n=1 Tax=Diadema setosum TaxID=31175 RepID=UPI003B3ABD7C